MPDGVTLPGWPLLMQERTAARYLDLSVRDFRAAVAAGVLPPPRELHPTLGHRWHRAEIEASTARTWGLDRLGAGGHDGRAAARAALDAYQPPTKTRRAPALRPGRAPA